MTQKEKFVISIMLKKYGLKNHEIDKLIEKFESRNKRYSVILRALDRLKKYFIDTKHYDNESFSIMLTNYQIYRYSTDKINKIEQVFIDNRYSEEELKTIEVSFADVFGYDADKLNRKLEFYNDVELKQAILDKPQRLQQGLTLSYARYQFLNNNGLYKINRHTLFKEECRYIRMYGVDNKELIKRYPLPKQYN